MSLQEEIAGRYLEPIYDDKGMETEDIELAKEIVSKILDAAVEAAKERLIGVSEAQGAKRDKLSMIVAGNCMIDSINKLRGE
jgi:hypothetical protein